MCHFFKICSQTYLYGHNNIKFYLPFLKLYVAPFGDGNRIRQNKKIRTAYARELLLKYRLKRTYVIIFDLTIVSKFSV